jgi:hypothetical protein
VERDTFMEPETVLALFRALRSAGVDYVLVGAVALDVLGIGRFTDDIDLFVRPDRVNVEHLRRALTSVWNDPSVAEITVEDLAGPYPVVQYVAPDGTQIDLLSRLGEAFAFEDLESMNVRYGDVEVVVASPRTLYAMKRGTVRLQDKADAQKLKERFQLED